MRFRPLILHVCAGMLLATFNAFSRADSVILSIGNGSNDTAQGSGTLTGGGGGYSGSIIVSAGETAADAATALAASIGNGSIANGNQVTISNTASGQIFESAGAFDTLGADKEKKPPKPKPVPPPPSPPIIQQIINYFFGRQMVGANGSITKSFAGDGWSISTSVNFVASETFAEVNSALLVALDQQASSLPAGFYFQGTSNEVSLWGPDTQNSLSVTDTLSITSGSLPAGTQIGISAVPEPGTITMLAIGMMALFGYAYGRRMS